MTSPSNPSERNPDLPAPRYIGDGVYIGHDGYQIILETSDGIRVTNRIGLDDEVLAGMEQYRRQVREFYAERRQRRDEAEAAAAEPQPPGG